MTEHDILGLFSRKRVSINSGTGGVWVCIYCVVYIYICKITFIPGFVSGFDTLSNIISLKAKKIKAFDT
jgi:hypothetical protein